MSQPNSKKYISQIEVRQRFDVTYLTLWLWRNKRPLLGFPQPALTIRNPNARRPTGGRVYYLRKDIDAFERRREKAARRPHDLARA